MVALDVYRAIWRRRYLIVFLTAIATATAWALASSQPKVYEATALVRIQQRIADPTDARDALSVGERLARTYARIVSTRSIGERIFRQLDGRVPRHEISVSGDAERDVDLLYVTATASTPENAAAVANAAPFALRQLIAETGTLRDQIVTVDRAEAGRGASSTPISPRPVRTAVLAFLIALIFNGSLALLIEFLSDRLPEVDDLESSMGKPVLGIVPELKFERASVELGGRPRLAQAAQRLTSSAPVRRGT
jgi:capsular polysaccharide biosynthesis protein